MSSQKGKRDHVHFAEFFSPYGRIGRRYFVRCMFLFIVCFYLSGILGEFLIALHPLMGMLLVVALSLFLIILMLGLTVRRYHDFGCSGWVPGGFAAATFLFAILDNLPSMPLRQIFSAATLEVVAMVWSALNILVLFFIPALWPGKRG